MAAWHAYFLIKIALHFLGRLRLDPFLDAALLALAVAPGPARWGRARAAAAWVLAATLAWHESWLPAPATAWNFLTDSSTRPTLGYVVHFLAQAANASLILSAAALGAAAICASRRGLRLTPVVLVGLAAVAVSDPTLLHRGGASGALAHLRAREAERVVHFELAAEPTFDVMVIHVCSLSWDDLRAAQMTDDPFWRSFNVVFTRFNSAASYSNPASIRVLRAPCGQTDHAALFATADAGCYLLDALRRLGYKSWSAYNHDGDYAHYASALTENAHADGQMPLDGIPAPRLSFDDSRIYDDGAVLARWNWERGRSGAARAVVYYNSVSLHQGAHARNQPGNWFEDREIHFRDAARGFFSTLDKFFADYAKTGRRAVVLFVAEHGAALEGSAVQAPDMRDVPLPALTLVPLAVKIIGPGAPAATATAFARPVSYLAMAELLRRFLERPPFGRGAMIDDYLKDLPETPFLSENETTIVFQHDGRYLVQDKGGRWKTLPPDAARDKTPD